MVNQTHTSTSNQSTLITSVENLVIFGAKYSKENITVPTPAPKVGDILALKEGKIVVADLTSAVGAVADGEKWIGVSIDDLTGLEGESNICLNFLIGGEINGNQVQRIDLQQNNEVWARMELRLIGFNVKFPDEMTEVVK